MHTEHVEQRRRYILIEAGSLIAEDTPSPSAISVYVDVDFRLGTIEILGNKLELGTFMNVAKAICRDYERLVPRWSEKYSYPREYYDYTNREPKPITRRPT